MCFELKFLPLNLISVNLDFCLHLIPCFGFLHLTRPMSTIHIEANFKSCFQISIYRMKTVYPINWHDKLLFSWIKEERWKSKREERNDKLVITSFFQTFLIGFLIDRNPWVFFSLMIFWWSWGQKCETICVNCKDFDSECHSYLIAFN